MMQLCFGVLVFWCFCVADDMYGSYVVWLSLIMCSKPYPTSMDVEYGVRGKTFVENAFTYNVQMSALELIGNTRDEMVYMAKLAEQGERYHEVC
jgi:hypothetical protein